jgi:hypothetical protein
MQESPSSQFLEPGDENAVALFTRGIEGPLTMLNLLKFRETADYSRHPGLAPATPITGRQAYERYVRHTLPYLEESGGELVYLGTGGAYLVGPVGQGWDMAMLVRQRSVESFMAFATNEEYLAGIGHRVAALEDSRILPLEETFWR